MKSSKQNMETMECYQGLQLNQIRDRNTRYLAKRSKFFKGKKLINFKITFIFNIFQVHDLKKNCITNVMSHDQKKILNPAETIRISEKQIIRRSIQKGSPTEGWILKKVLSIEQQFFLWNWNIFHSPMQWNFRQIDFPKIK